MQNAPVIIKRKKVVAGEGHHGGAWKVAYADFVTAMMAFFMLMWLLNATTETQRKGIADYFTPTIAISRMSGGGDGAFNGDSVFTTESLAQSGNGGTGQFAAQVPIPGDPADSSSSEEAAQVAALYNLEAELMGRGGESMLSDRALRHVITKVTDEGLIIEIFDLPDVHLFEPRSDVPTQITKELGAMFAQVLGLLQNDIAIGGHTRSRPLAVSENPVWALSTDRAQSLRILLEEAGLDPERISRVVGHADRLPASQNTLSIRNNRMEIIVLRSDV